MARKLLVLSCIILGIFSMKMKTVYAESPNMVEFLIEATKYNISLMRNVEVKFVADTEFSPKWAENILLKSEDLRIRVISKVAIEGDKTAVDIQWFKLSDLQNPIEVRFASWNGVRNLNYIISKYIPGDNGQASLTKNNQYVENEPFELYALLHFFRDRLDNVLVKNKDNIEYLGVSNNNGINYHKIKFSPGGIQLKQIYLDFDESHGLMPARWEIWNKGKCAVSEVVQEFKSVGEGIYFPVVTNFRLGDETTWLKGTVKVEYIKVNTDVDDKVFEFVIPPGTSVSDIDAQIGYIEGETP